MQKGLDFRHFLRPLSQVPLDQKEKIEKTWLVVEKCSFCGLGFAPLWAVRLASCKHFYHNCVHCFILTHLFFVLRENMAKRCMRFGGALRLSFQRGACINS
jgi:hypothetical protein